MSTATLGANTQVRAPMKKMVESPMMVVRRPNRSRDAAASERTDSGGEGERSGDPALGGGVHAEFAAHGFERAVDHSGCRSRRAAEGGDECNDAEVSAVLPGAQRGQGGGGALCVMVSFMPVAGPAGLLPGGRGG